MTRNVRVPVPAILRSAQQYLFYRDQAAEAEKLKKQAIAVPGEKNGNAIKDHVAKVGKPAGEHVEWYFDEPLTVGKSTYLGFRNEAKTSTFIDTDLADELIARKNLENAVTKVQTYTDYNELYNLNQLGHVTDDEIDSILVTETNYALTVIK